MEKIPNANVANSADRYQEAADLIESNAAHNGNGGLAWTACINAALAVEIYLKSFLTEKVLTETGTGMNLVTQKRVNGHDLFQLYQKIDSNIQTIILAASKEIDDSIELEKLIKHCKDYFFQARYPYEKESLLGLNLNVVVLARHMRRVVVRVSEKKHTQ